MELMRYKRVVLLFLFILQFTNAKGAVLVAAGNLGHGYRTPILAVSNDPNAGKWALKSGTDFPDHGYFNTASCMGRGTTAVCTAVGQDDIASLPLLTVSTDGGSNWMRKSVNGLPYKQGIFHATSCTNTGATAICTAAGSNISVDDPTRSSPLIAVSNDGGNSWAVKSPPVFLYGSLQGISCTGSGANAVCVAVGTNDVGGPLLVLSQDGGQTWTMKSISTNLSFNSVSCTGSGSNAICAAVGTGDTEGSSDNGLFLLTVSTDGGNTWSIKSIPNLPNKGFFNSVSCTGSGPTAICAAAAWADGPPLLVVSTDGGNTWMVKQVKDFPSSAYGRFYSVSCSGSAPTAICVAAGTAKWGPAGPPLLAVSLDGGNNWLLKQVPGLPSNCIFQTTSCTGSGPTAICTAGGSIMDVHNNDGPPMLAMSTNGGNNWKLESIPNITSFGFFNGAAATDG